MFCVGSNLSDILLFQVLMELYFYLMFQHFKIYLDNVKIYVLYIIYTCRYICHSTWNLSDMCVSVYLVP